MVALGGRPNLKSAITEIISNEYHSSMTGNYVVEGAIRLGLATKRSKQDPRWSTNKV